jgi:hypothetical protein
MINGIVMTEFCKTQFTLDSQKRLAKDARIEDPSHSHNNGLKLPEGIVRLPTADCDRDVSAA